MEGKIVAVDVEGLRVVAPQGLGEQGQVGAAAVVRGQTDQFRIGQIGPGIPDVEHRTLAVGGGFQQHRGGAHPEQGGVFVAGSDETRRDMVDVVGDLRPVDPGQLLRRHQRCRRPTQVSAHPVAHRQPVHSGAVQHQFGGCAVVVL